MTCSLDWTYTWRPVKLGSVPVLHLKASQTWFCSDLTLKCQSNLVLKFCYLFTYLDIPFCQFGCTLNLLRLSTWLNLQLWCQLRLCLTSSHTSTYLDLPLTVNAFSYTCLPGLTFDCQIWLGFEILWKLWSVWITFFLPEGLYEAFIGLKTFSFYSAFMFQIRKHISDSICHAMYDYAWMKCLNIFHSNSFYPHF